MSKPKADYTITVYEPDDMGNICIECSVPGVVLYGPHLDDLLADIPYAVDQIRHLNREPSAPTGEQ